MIPCGRCGTPLAPGTAVCPTCGTAQPTQPVLQAQPTQPGAVPVGSYCNHCGTAVPAGAAFCPTCGTPAGGSPSTPPGGGQRGVLVAAFVAAGVLVVVLIVLIAVLLVRRNDNQVATDGATTVSSATSLGSSSSTSTTAPASTTTAAPTTTTTAPTTTTADPGVAALRGAMVDLDRILVQSTQGRGQVGNAVAGVKSCSINPQEASREINNVISNRQSVLAQINAVDTRGSAQAGALVGQLRNAIQYSIDADIHYRDWMVFLYTDYYYTTPIGCPSGAAPTNAAYDAGNASSGQATNAKRSFVSAYNPVAQSYGLRTWSDTEI